MAYPYININNININTCMNIENSNDNNLYNIQPSWLSIVIIIKTPNKIEIKLNTVLSTQQQNSAITRLLYKNEACEIPGVPLSANVISERIIYNSFELCYFYGLNTI